MGCAVLILGRHQLTAATNLTHANMHASILTYKHTHTNQAELGAQCMANVAQSILIGSERMNRMLIKREDLGGGLNSLFLSLSSLSSPIVI